MPTPFHLVDVLGVLGDGADAATAERVYLYVQQQRAEAAAAVGAHLRHPGDTETRGDVPGTYRACPNCGGDGLTWHADTTDEGLASVVSTPDAILDPYGYAAMGAIPVTAPAKEYGVVIPPDAPITGTPDDDEDGIDWDDDGDTASTEHFLADDSNPAPSGLDEYAPDTTTNPTAPVLDETPATIRAWAASAGVTCPKRGTIPTSVLTQYRAAHGA